MAMLYTVWAKDRIIKLESSPTAEISTFSITAHLMATSAFHIEVDVKPIFSNALSSELPQGFNEFISISQMPNSSIEFVSFIISVYLKLRYKPFEPKASCDLSFLPYKMVFLVTITSAHPVKSEHSGANHHL